MISKNLMAIIVVIIIGCASLGLLVSTQSIDVEEELTPVSADYDLKISSVINSLYTYTYANGTVVDDVYETSYNGKVNVVLNTSDIPDSKNHKLDDILTDYVKNDNEKYNSEIDLNFTAYDANGKEIDTDFSYGKLDTDLNYKTLDLLALSYKDNYDSSLSYANNLLTLLFEKNDTNMLTLEAVNSKITGIDHINGELHIYNPQYTDDSSPDYYNFTLKFVINSKDINIHKT
jgi:hypothetical protein